MSEDFLSYTVANQKEAHSTLQYLITLYCTNYCLCTKKLACIFSYY